MVLAQASQHFTSEMLGFVVVAVLGLLWLSIAIAEAAFFTLSAEDLNKLSQGRSRWEKSLLTLMNYPQHVQITNLFLRCVIKISIITWVVMALRAATATPGWLFLFMIGISLAVLLGDLTAKRIALKHRDWILRRTTTFLKVLAFAFMPLSIPLLKLQQLVVNILGQRGKASEKATSRVLNEALNEIEMTTEENEVARGVANFGAISVRQLMRQRRDVVAIDIASDFFALEDIINRFGYSRIPAYRSTLDTIEGVVYIKDLIPFADQQRGFEWQKLIRPAFFVSESTRLSVLLKDFQQKHVHIALVLDKYGRVVGLITLQDLIEEVIDDINEEFNSVNPGA
jgi:putative hemolysin